MPTDPAPQVETRVEWRNVYASGYTTEWMACRDYCDERAKLMTERVPASSPRIAVEERTTNVTITRHPLGGTERE